MSRKWCLFTHSAGFGLGPGSGTDLAAIEAGCSCCEMLTKTTEEDCGGLTAAAAYKMSTGGRNEQAALAVVMIQVKKKRDCSTNFHSCLKAFCPHQQVLLPPYEEAIAIPPKEPPPDYMEA